MFRVGKYGADLMLTTLRQLLASYSPREDEARREYIFNVIALTLVMVTSVMFVTTTYLNLVYPERNGVSVSVIATIWLIFTGLFILGKSKYRSLARQLLLICLLVPSLYSLEHWGLLLAMPLLGCGLVILMAVILHNSRVALVYTLVITTYLAVLNWGQSLGLQNPDETWTQAPIHHTYWVELSVMFGTLLIVAWLAEREIKAGFARAAQAEKELAKERDQLEIRLQERTEQLQKMHNEYVSPLLKFANHGKEFAGYFHDLINPITAASITLEQASETTNSSSYPLLKKAELAMHHAVGFIQSIQKQLRKEAVPTLIILSEEITRAIDIVQPKLRRQNIALHTDLHDDGGYYMDPIKLFQVLSNLVNNAVDACSYNPTMKARHIWLTAQANPDLLHLTIRDTGPGIAPEIQAKVFEPMVTTKPINKGTGLGLTIVKHIVTQEYGGSICLTETSPKGTTFTVHLPAAKRPLL